MKRSLLVHFYSTLMIPNLAYSTMARNMRAVRIKEFGAPSNLYVRQDEPVPQIVSQDEVLLRVAATALNRADTLQRKGSYNPPKGTSDILGLEASGVIDAIGENVKNFNVGDRVMALLAGGGYAEYVLVPYQQLIKIPTQMDFVSAAAIPEVWLTAYQLLHFVAKINPGECVLVHAAGSGVGTAAIQLVKAIPGTTVIATAGTTEKLEKAKELGADVLVNYKSENFSTVVKELTENRGVNIVLDPVGASNVEQNIESLGVDGRWVLYGTMGGIGVSNDKFLGLLLRKRIQLLPTTLRGRSIQYKKELVESFAKSSIDKFVSKTFVPIIDTVTTLDLVSEAHERMEANLNSGKIVMKVSDHLLKDEL